ncbi:LCP family protein [Streptomyces sp. NBC_01431]|uniref:LCP family protein n=1 Tax=Streptomyces sp. NBC_01431 TaxID=2903863 RepID=UPI002E2F12A2|nr:LCP family protein [Streptomyces sp. NBC_01431]
MNDRQYDPYAPQVQLVGYDEYGRPVYQQVQPQQQTYDPYAQPQEPQQPQQQGYGHDAQYVPQQSAYDPYAQQQPHQPQQFPQQDYGYDYGTAQQPAVQAPPAPQQAPEPEAVPVVPQQRRDEGGDRGESGERDYRTEQFSFIEEPDEDSEDVIDWLKFTESRSERREEAKRRGRNRIVALVVALALVAVGGVGYLWYAGKLPFLSSSSDTKKGATAAGPQKRDVIEVDLHNTKSGGTSTALLVNNATTQQGTTVLLPNSLSVPNDDGSRTTLGKSVGADGSAGTRDSISSLLGTKITGTWRLDTPYLENLVDLVGNIDISTDVDVPAAKQGGDPVVKKGDDQTLSGPMAVAYATYKGPGEADTKQLQRFGAVMYGVLRKISDDPKAATVTVQTLAQILDPSLPESDLGASLAKLAEHAKTGAYKTAVLPVQSDGSLSQQASDSVVKDILGGQVGGGVDKGTAVRVGVKNASGNAKATEAARITLVNGGYAFIDAGNTTTEAVSQVLYGDPAQKAKAIEVAKTLGLADSAVKQGKAAANSDVSVVIGKDYKLQQ